jgi:hypothetical protein
MGQERGFQDVVAVVTLLRMELDQVEDTWKGGDARRRLEIHVTPV